jgi:hypothetical protein
MLGAQAHGQVDYSEGRCRDGARQPVPAALRRGGHDQAGGQHDFCNGEPKSPSLGNPELTLQAHLERRSRRAHAIPTVSTWRRDGTAWAYRAGV